MMKSEEASDKPGIEKRLVIPLWPFLPADLCPMEGTG